MSYQETVWVFVLACDFIIGDEVCQLLDEAHHLLVPGDVGHGEVAGWAFTTVGHALRRNMETVTFILTLHKFRAVPAHQLQQTLKTVWFVPASHRILWKGNKFGRGIRNQSLSQWHITKPLCAQASPAVKHRLVFILESSFKSIQMMDTHAPQLPRSLREGHLVLKYNMPGRKSRKQPVQQVSVTLLEITVLCATEVRTSPLPSQGCGFYHCPLVSMQISFQPLIKPSSLIVPREAPPAVQCWLSLLPAAQFNYKRIKLAYFRCRQLL